MYHKFSLSPYECLKDIGWLVPGHSRDQHVGAYNNICVRKSNDRFCVQKQIGFFSMIYDCFWEIKETLMRSNLNMTVTQKKFEVHIYLDAGISAETHFIGSSFTVLAEEVSRNLKRRPLCHVTKRHVILCWSCSISLDRFKPYLLLHYKQKSFTNELFAAVWIRSSPAWQSV